MVESTIKDELREAVVRLQAAGIDSAQLDAVVLLEQVLRVDRTYVIGHTERRLDGEDIARYHRLLARREKREPLPYITGKKEFWSLKFQVTPAVLIPRPETEILVEQAIIRLKGRPVTVADIGVGSGAIAIALAKELPDARVFATELSFHAMQVAAANMVNHQVENRITLLPGDLLEPLDGVMDGLLDVVVSNPPYVQTGELDKLQPEVSKYEPRQALDGGVDGLKYLRWILDDARRFLNRGGYVILELGADQSAAVVKLARDFGYQSAEIAKDLAGLDRVLIASY